MKYLLILVSTLLAGAASAKTFTWYEVSALECRTLKGITLSYDMKKDPNVVTSRWFLARKDFLANGARFVVEDNTTQIAFTGHQRSAGPVIDYWESDYAISITGPLKEGVQDVSGDLLESKAFGPFLLVDKISCAVESREIFNRH